MLNPNPNIRPPDEANMKQSWNVLAMKTEQNPGSMVDEWIKVGCDAQGAPYVIAALAGRIKDKFGEAPAQQAEPTQEAKLAKAFLGPDCAGAAGMLAATRATLTKLSKLAPIVPDHLLSPTSTSPSPPNPAPMPAAPTQPNGVVGFVPGKRGWPVVGTTARLSGLTLNSIEDVDQDLFKDWIMSHGDFFDCKPRPSSDGVAYQCFTPQGIDVAQAVLLNGGACTADREGGYHEAQAQAEKAKRGRWRDGGAGCR
jgi:hypothetical protein